MTLKSKKLDVLFFVLGGLLVAVGISIFNAPNGIASGGFTGIATILNSLLKIPIGSTVLIMNIPIFIIGANKYGLKFIYKSIIATMIMTVLIDIVAYILPFYKGEKILCAVFGGLLTGVGLGIVFLRGATTGGVDIIAKILGEKFPHISIGNIILLLDGVVIIASAIVYQNIENALFAVVAIFVQSKAIDTILYGSDKGRLILVKSEHCEEIVKKSKLILGRTPTFLDNVSEKRNVLLCATHRYEAARFHNIVKSVDKSAFIVTMEAGEIFGEGFSSFESA